jgi:Flp pilus assembly protein TadG
MITVNTMPKQPLARRSVARRRGAYTVEFAIAAPLFFMFVMATIEFGRMHMIRNTLDNAVYEGARRGLVLNSTASDVTTAVNAVLTASRIRNATTTSTITNDLVTVTTTVSMNDNSWAAPVFFKNLQLRSTLTLNRK